MNSNWGEVRYIEDVYPWIEAEMCSFDNIVSMIEKFEEFHPDNFSNELKDYLDSKPSDYVDFANQIFYAISVYEKHTWKKFDFNYKPIQNDLEKRELKDLEQQMEEFKRTRHISEGISYTTQKKRLWVKAKIKALMEWFKK